MPTDGDTLSCRRPGSSSVQSVRCPSRSSSARLVHTCPLAGTYCRSSRQIRHSFGGSGDGGYWLPQVRQIHPVPGELAVLAVLAVPAVLAVVIRPPSSERADAILDPREARRQGRNA